MQVELLPNLLSFLFYIAIWFQLAEMETKPKSNTIQQLHDFVLPQEASIASSSCRTRIIEKMFILASMSAKWKFVFLFYTILIKW